VPHGRGGDDGRLDRPVRRPSVDRRAQHFSYWMTTMLHGLDGASDFDRERQRAELELVTGSSRGSAYLADGYTGWQHLK
jgi:p-hydroxybenzoate 3-monooxygenase